MKKFAKYIPVDGEIQEGDIGLDPFGLPYHCKDGKMLDEDESTYYLLKDYSDKFRKVKLMLCSREVKVGDKMRMTDNPFLEVEWTEKLDFSKSNTFTGTDPDAFKVIGEISPDALEYVKEGDEFDEDVVRILPIDHDPYARKGIFAKVKCPCCKKFN